MERRTYHFRVSMWLLFMSLSAFLLWVSAAGITMFSARLGDPDIFVRIFSFIAVIVDIYLFLLGLQFIFFPFITKIILSSQGIELHKWSKVIKSEWSGVTTDNPEDIWEEISVLHLSHPQVIFRPWTRYVPWERKIEPGDSVIHISSFGGLSRRQFIEDIQRFDPYLGMR